MPSNKDNELKHDVSEMSGTTRLHVRLTRKTYRELEAISKSEGRSISDVVRQIINQYVREFRGDKK